MNNDIVKFILPASIGYVTSMFCDIGGKAGKTVKIRPPAQVFGIVWPILYALIGYAWVLASRTKVPYVNELYFLLSALLGLWIVIYGCKKDKKSAIYVLAASIASALAAYGVSPHRSKIMLSPLIGWLLLATFLNVLEVEKSF